MAKSSTVEAVPIRKDADGVFRVGDSRITLDVVIAAYTEGASAEEIASQYSSISLADIYQAIGYYLRHEELLSAYLEARRAQSNKIRDLNERRSPAAGIRQRL